MRHGKKFNHLGRTAAHRKAMLSNMACSLIEHKRINTTVAKAKALRSFVEPIISRSKDDSTHSRRMAFRRLKSKHAVSELFRNVGPAVANRDGGYTRIIRTGFRPGDNADMCMIELVDFNTIYGTEAKAKKKRTRRGGAKKVADAAAAVQDTAAAVTSEAADAAAAVADTATDAVETAADAVENVADQAADAAADVAEKATDAVEGAADAAEEAVADATEAAEEAADDAADAAEGDDASDEDKA